MLQYTGGTTGTPKGAMLTHANVYINVMQVVPWAPELIEAQERVLGVLPFFHVFAMTVVMNFGIAKAAEIIIMPRFVLDDALKLIDKAKPTVMPGVPTLFNAMMNHPKLKSFDLSSLKFCLSGGAPLPLEVKQRLRAADRLQAGGGLRPVGGFAHRHRQSARRAGQGGLHRPADPRNDRLAARARRSRRSEVPLGEKGEICVKGPQVMKGYWKRPEETADQFVGDYLRTGDVGIMDEEGFLFIVDRIKDLIICSGYNVYPRRIEEAIYEHPGGRGSDRDRHQGPIPRRGAEGVHQAQGRRAGDDRRRSSSISRARFRASSCRPRSSSATRCPRP